MNLNQIHKTACIDSRVRMGSYNKIGKNVIIEIIGDNPEVKVVIGDNNIINDNTRIYVRGSFIVGDWNVFHNDMLIMPEEFVIVGHNCWFGQNTILDGAGGLEIRNGVRVGMYSQIWTHVGSGEQIEGCILFSKRKTVIHDDVWLVGSCVVVSGLELEPRSTFLINSVVTKNSKEGKVYSGNPIKIIENLNLYLPKTLDEKFYMLKQWIEDFAKINQESFLIESDTSEIRLVNVRLFESVIFTKSENKLNDRTKSIFYLFDKTFNKTNIFTERMIYKYLYNNKARFIPLDTEN